ncbi:Hypothetical predicted protein [Cloeon dipterum]|uniref:Uncharacterized protein n=1 Tax=Cloeon dipterum TaxID=197152 RepID=A0A8S1CEB2_9INSE|nr:Hypothetical predicted protein [Cloeon dipterum]
MEAACVTLGQSCSNETSIGEATCCPWMECDLGQFVCVCTSGAEPNEDLNGCDVATDATLTVTLIISLTVACGIISYLFVKLMKKLRQRSDVVAAAQNVPSGAGNVRRIDSDRNTDSVEPRNRSSLYLIMNETANNSQGDLPEGDWQTVIETYDLPPAYPGSPQEESPPPYASVVK